MRFLPILCLAVFAGALNLSPTLYSKPYSLQIAVLKYNGGGDWYANPTSLTNLAAFFNRTFNASIDPDYEIVEAGSPDIFSYPFVHMTGHGNVVFSNDEARNLRLYLMAGGFLHIDDNYGMDKFIRPELKKVFPEYELQPIPASHPVFHQNFDFKAGLPKIHEHDQQTPQAYGIFHEGRMILMYTTESDLGDGWEDAEVHNDPPEVRLKALQMGCNILQYVFTTHE